MASDGAHGSGYGDVRIVPSQEKLLGFTESFIFRWLRAILSALKVFRKHNACHYSHYKRLESDSKDLFQKYWEFKEKVLKNTTLDCYPSLDTIMKGPLYQFKFRESTRAIRSPRGSGEGPKIQKIRDRCSELLQELGNVKIILQTWDEAREAEEGNGKQASPVDPLMVRDLNFQRVDRAWVAQASLCFGSSKLFLRLV